MLIQGGQTETGFIGEAIQAGSGLVDIIAGGPQKRERAAKAELAAAQEMRAAEEARLAAAQLAATTPAPAPMGGLMAHRTLGIPTVLLVGAAVVGAVLLARRK
jgi:hypothetical protein